MKKHLVLFTLLSLSVSLSAWAQKEYRLAKNTGRLNLNINGAIVEGYDGNDIIFSAKNTAEEEVDERAKGLKAINGSGFTDNTGIGVDVTENGQDINVNMVSRKLKGIITIKVPQNIKIYFANNSNVYFEEVILKNLKNEIEVSTTYNKIKLENNSGPMNIKTVYGSVDASFAGDIKGPVSIISVYSYVDVSIPAATKANLELGTSYGKLYSADEFKITIDKNSAREEKSGSESVGTTESGRNTVNMRRIDGDNSAGGLRGPAGMVTTFSSIRQGEYIKGTINGGGADLILKSNYKNVYLRKK